MHTKILHYWRDLNLCLLLYSTKIKNLLSNTDVMESCRRPSQHKMEVLQADECYNFCSISQKSSRGLQRHLLPDPLLKNHSVKCLTFEENTRKPYNDKLCFFRSLALHLSRNERLQEVTSKFFNLFLKKKQQGLILQILEVFF